MTEDYRESSEGVVIVRAEKIVGLANSVLGGNRGEALKLIAKGAQMWRDPNAKLDEALPNQPGPNQPGPNQPGPNQPGPNQPGMPGQTGVPGQPWMQAPGQAGYGPTPTQSTQPYTNRPSPPYSGPPYSSPPYSGPPYPGQQPTSQPYPPYPGQPQFPVDAGLEADEWAILRIMAAAAQADGSVAPHEQNTILSQANKLGASPNQMQQLNFELRQRVAVAEIVQSVDSVAVRKLMYQLAFMMVKSDHQVTQQEMAFLTELAKATELSHEVLAQLVR